MLYGIAVVSSIGMGHWFNFASIIVGGGVIVFSLFLPWLCAHKKALIAILSVLAIMTVYCGALLSRIFACEKKGPDDDAEYVIILGAKVDGTSPKREFAERIRTGAEYLKSHPDAKAVTTGGKGSDEGIEEAAAAKIMLISLGISEDRILVEDRSKTTRENFEFAKDLINNDGGDYREDRVVIASSNFHLYRAGEIAKAAGYMNISYLGSSGIKLLLPHYYMREIAAITKEMVLN